MIAHMPKHRTAPFKRVNPSGKTAWVARWIDKDGKRRYGWPPDIKGTYPTKREAQAAITACYDREEHGPLRYDTVGAYFETWTTRHPRMARTNQTNESRIKAVLDVRIEGTKLRDWPLASLRRRHVSALLDHLLRVQGRAYTGARNVLRSLSAMAEDAVTDEVAMVNPFVRVRVSANDPRLLKAPTPVRVFSWEEMHAFARAAGSVEAGPDLESVPPQLRENVAASAAEMVAWRRVYAEAMVRVLSDCGLRIGELLPVRRADLDLTAGTLRVVQTAWQGQVLEGTKSDRLRQKEGEPGRVVPVPPGLCAMLAAMPKRIDSPFLFPSPHGRLWDESSWRKRVWAPARRVTGSDARPHEFRHSFVSHLRAAGVDDADLAAITGHTVLTMVSRYTHSLGRSFDAVREAVGQ